MKKTTTLKTLAAAAMTLLAASCAKEQLSDNGGQAGVSFTVEVPGAPATKAIGDGTTAKTLYYQVFDEQGEPISKLGAQTTTFGVDGKAKVNFQLVKDQTYNFIFWAQTNESGYYTIGGTEEEKDLRTITANYDGKKANDENFDAFFAVEKALKISGPVTKNITLKRPFAQINIASNDRISAGGTPQTINFEGAKSEIAIKGIPTTFSPLTGALAGAGESYVEFAKASAPLNEVKVNEVTYTNLAMNYVFAPADGAVCDIKATFTVDGKNVLLSVPNAPIKRNWRTNIVGNILTSEADFNVVIAPGFADDTEDIYVPWDGTTAVVTPNAAGEYEIRTGAELAWVAKEVIASAVGNSAFSGKTVKLMNDIYLADSPWTPIGRTGGPDGMMVCFCGTFDGQGHTIYDLNVSNMSSTKSNAEAGLFGELTGTIKNLTVRRAKISSSHYAGVICAHGEGNGKIENCKVYDATVVSTPAFINNAWDNGDKAGAIAGYVADVEISGCYVENTSITAYRDLGGIVGYANTSSKVQNNTLGAGVVLTVDASHNYKNYTNPSEHDANTFVGEAASTATVSGNTGTATINLPPITIADNATFASSFASIEDGSTIALASGTYTIPTQKALKNVTFVGNGETVIDLGSGDNPTGAGKSYDNVMFKNIKFITWSSDNKGFQHSGNLVFDGCTFAGKHFGYGTKETYINCVFNQTVVDYSIWTYGAKEMIFENCTFNSLGKSLLVYNEGTVGSSKIYLSNCNFTATQVAEGKAAIEIDSRFVDYEVYITNCTSTGFDNGSVSGNSLWNNKSMAAEHSLMVTVDGDVKFNKLKENN